MRIEVVLLPPPCELISASPLQRIEQQSIDQL